MTTTLQQRNAPAARARVWRIAALSASCDLIEPWDHGTIFRASRYPSYYDLNVLWVETPSQLRAHDLIAHADRALEGLSHRLIEFADAADAEALRPEFERRGWRSLRLVWMRHSRDLPAAPRMTVEELPFGAVRDLKVRWHHEDFPGTDPAAFHREAREVALRRRARVFAALEDGIPVAFAQLEQQADGAEVSEVYVRRDRRGRRLGTAVTRAAVAAATDARDVWICADAEDRPKRLYHRLGFRAVAETMQFLRLPG
jgi:ribosomal protein S18 acetylase RimI-like enzyme